MSQDRWTDVKSRVEGLGLKLKLHLQQEADNDDEREEGSTRAAFDDLTDRLEDAFESFGNAAKDPAVRTDVKELGLLLKDAIQDTLSGVGAEVGDRLRQTRAASSTDSTPADDADGPFKPSDDDEAQDTVQDSTPDAEDGSEEE